MNESLISKINKGIAKSFQWMRENQTEEGTWPVPYDGPMFLLPLYIFALRICKKPISSTTQRKMSNYILRHQLRDGSYGMHQESKSGTLFTSIINYIALRFLGLEPTDAEVKYTLQWIHQKGGPLQAASWCKFILSFLNLYSYKGVAPVPPELYMLPSWFPFHPRKISGYVRIIYLPMSYFYREKLAIEADSLILALREELYQTPYESIHFAKYRGNFAIEDDIVPVTKIYKISVWWIKRIDPLIPRHFKKRALALVYNHIRYEDEHSNYIRQAPVNAVYNTLIHHFRGDTVELEKSWEKLPLYLWESEEEILMQGFTNTFTWDCDFFLQTLMETPNAEDLKRMALKTRKFLLKNQVHKELPSAFKYHRLPRQGGWTFSYLDNGWVVSDCTAEAIKGLLETESYGGEILTDANLEMAIQFVLLLQGKDGGWTSVDKAIGSPKLEWFNAANVFVDIMIDHSYVECTGSILQCFATVKKYRPHLYTPQMEEASENAIKYLLNSQNADGSWEALWGLCFTYGICFVTEGLRMAGLKEDHVAIQNACAFLWDFQKEDGGWGEAQESALARRYIQAENSVVEQTAWAIIALINGGFQSDERLKKAINWLLHQQGENGDWPVQPMSGLFYKTVMIHYRNYKRYFPLLALQKYRKNSFDS
ncbi:prenyltransferase/squalene oxidase repeat-containing protein [Eudoraea chungangensis]|uniref:prenyltransferase/squalene oxidase repeat-containing protein n=1 Tax=Eudoraea chungangensis TaxID=1481905 RepID=UPI0023ED6B31|nr:prenyltransferase/squalene oxidase repeat-containing protein [Eudoraea chungangensis]